MALPLHRRRFLGGLGALGVGAALPLAGCDGDDAPAAAPSTPEHPPEPPAPRAAPSGPLRFFSEAEGVTMAALLARIWPSGEGVPGARETGVLRYVDGQLLEPHFRGMGRLFRDGLARLDGWARAEHGAAFAELAPARQDALLERVQTGRLPGRFPAPRFFALVHAFGLEGHLGDPRHGGNHARRGWDWLGVDPSCGSGMHACGEEADHG